MTLLTLVPLAFTLFATAEPPSPPAEPSPLVVLISGDEEYRSEETLPMLASILRRDFGFRTRVLFSLDAEGRVDPERLDHLPGTEILADADLLILFTRFRALPESQVRPILNHAAAGRPIVGLRTATHAFRYPPDHELASTLNEVWPQRVLGQRWITHHGHFDEGKAPLTRVTPTEKSHPTTHGVGSFDAYSWLYHVEGGADTLPPGTTRLASGRALKSIHGERHDRFPLENPVAWAIEREVPGLPDRVFFTTLGHPYDFRSEDARRLLVQGVLWSLGRESEIPPTGLPVVTPPGWRPSNAGFGAQRPHRNPDMAVREPDQAAEAVLPDEQIEDLQTRD
ncbi:MAG: hypothetical protein CMJ23_11780 [Phycisphaerae bacterium]|nr:hypothetical protein [Phycisphaerae bacterium]